MVGRGAHAVAHLAPAWPRRLALPLSGAALFVAYFALAQVSYQFVFPPSKNAVFWLPSGVTLAVFLRTHAKRWPTWCAAILLAETVVVLQHGLPLRMALAWGTAGFLLPLSGALLMRRFAPAPYAIRTVRDVVLFVGLAAAAAIPGTLVAATAEVLWLGVPSSFHTAVSWWASDVLGVLLVGPLVLSWVAPAPRPAGGALEALALLVATTGVGWWIFANATPTSVTASLPYVLLPITAWAALRFGTRGATLATTIIDLLAIWHSSAGQGPFAVASATAATRVLNVQTFVVVVSVFALLMATAVAQLRETLAAAEQAERRSKFLADATAALSESLDHTAILGRLARLSVQWLAEWCVIDEVDKDGTIRRVAGAHADPAREPLLRELQARYPPNARSPHPAAEVLRTGTPVLFPVLTNELRRAYVVDDEHDRLIRDLGARTAIAVPLVVRGKTTGVITLASAVPGTHYGVAELELAEGLARRAAVAVDNARLYGEAQDAVRIREEFLSIASHELNTPIMSLLLSVQALKNGLHGSPDLQQRGLSLAERQVRRLARQIQELLDISRITAGRLELHLEDVDLAAVVRDVAERYTVDLARAACPLSVDGLTSVIGRWDPARLEQVVANLLSNAIKFGGGRPIEVAVREAAGTATLSIKDYGIGIPRDRQPHIFDRFERAVSARAYGGLGLGLYIVRSIVDALGGSVSVASEVGSGTTFTVVLPRAGPPPRSTA